MPRVTFMSDQRVEWLGGIAVTVIDVDHIVLNVVDRGGQVKCRT